MRTQNKNNKILKFSIRKLSFGTAPVVIGALFFGSHVPSEALANENNSSVKYTYLAENELTESEKNLIKRSIPSDAKNNETYYMVYKKEAQTSTKPTTELKELPNTGKSSLPVAGLGIGTAVLVVLLMSKKHRNKVLSVVLIGAMGQSIVMPYESFAFENKELVRYNTQTTVANSSELANGVINIDGYRYVGYFTLSDLGVLPQEEQKVLPKPTEQKVEPTQPEQPTVEPTQPKQPTAKVEHKTTPEEGIKTVVVNKPELKSTTEVVPFETITQNDATLPKGQTKVVQEGVNGEQIVFSEVTTVDGKESSKVVKTSITKQPINKVIAVGTKEDVAPTPKVEYKTTPEEGVLNATVEKPELVVSTETIDFETITQNDATLPKGQTKVVQEGVNGERTIYTEVSTVNGEKSSKIVENTVTKQPVNKVVALGTKEDVAPQPVVVEPTQPETPKPEESKPTPQPETPKPAETKPTPQPETPKPEETKPEEKVDKTALKTQIDRALALVPADYSTTSYDALKPILAAAQNVYVSDSVKQPEIDSETSNLKAAIDALNVDKTYLNKTIADAKSKTKEHYSDTSWANLQNVLAEAEKVTNNPAAKQSEVDHINEQLKTAIAGLNTDKTELEKQLADAKSKTAADYSTASWNALEEAKKATQAVEDNVTATQAQINDAAKKLKAAIDALNVDKTKLQEQITSAETKQEADYSPKTWNDFKQAEIKAKEINDQTTPLPKQSEIDAATKALQDAIKALAVDKTALQTAINTANSKRKEEYTTQTWKALEDALAAVTPVNTDKTATQSKVDETTRRLEEAIKNLAPLTEKPVLKFVNTDKKVLDKEVVAKYTLDNPTKTKIKSITATLKKDGEVIKTVNLTEDNLNALLENVEYFKEYTLSTTMVYDRGNGEETETLEDQPIQLDLKKVEIKNIKETSLISVDDAGVETDSSLLSEKPTNVAPLYLRVTTHDNKVTRLSVDKIEEVEKDGKTLFKVTATAPDLVQHTDASKLANEYVHYFEKQKLKEGNVYYSFNELVKDMQDNPTGEFKLGADLNAANVKPNGKSYVTKPFKGKLLSNDGGRFTIHNIERPLFGNIEGGSVRNINLGNVNINMPGDNQVAPIANIIKNGAVIENVKVTGNVVGRDWVSGFIDKIDGSGTLRNVAFIGNVTSVGTGGSYLTGIVGENWKGLVEQAYVDANITGKKAKAAGIVYTSQNGGNNNGVGREGAIKKSVAKGTITVDEPIKIGGFIGTNHALGSVEDSVSMMKVNKGNGEIFYGSDDIDDDDGYWSGERLNRNLVVNGVSEGKSSYRFSKQQHRIKSVSQEEADKKIATLGITAHDYAINEPVINTLNNTKPKADTYKDTQDYKADHELAYRNIEKLQPFYNKEWIVNQGNKIPANSKLLTTEVLSVTAMKDNKFVTELGEANRIIVHYADKTKEIFNISPKESQVKQVKEYSIAELGEIVYTPNIVDKERSDLISAIESKLSPVELQSDAVYKLFGRNGDGKVNAVKNLYLEESFAYVKENLNKFVTKLVQNEDHQLNTDESAKRALIKKIDDNKAAVLLGLAYLNRYYGVKFDDFNIKELMLFKPDFYGNNVSLIDRLIEIGSKENNLKGDRTQDAFREVLAKYTRSGNLIDFLKYNMELLTSDRDINDWFIHSTDGKVYVVEKQSREEGLKNAKYRAFDNLSKGYHQKMILPLLNLTNTEAFLISTYNTISFGTANKYGKSMADVKNDIDLAASRHINYLDFWYRLATDEVKGKLAKDIVTPVWEGYKVWGHDWPSWMDRYGNFDDGKGIYAPVRELYGPVGEYYGHNGAVAGAYATYYDNKNDNRHKVVFVMSDMLTEYGTSAFTHETTHVNDRVAYYGGYTHREGTFLEAFAQGMLQSPAVVGNQGEYGALGLNMAFERENDGNQWYNPNPNKLKSRAEIDHYMKNYNETLMMLDYLEAESVLPKLKSDNDRWFKKMDKQMRKNGQPHQFDKIRDLNDTEKALQLNNINDLIDNNFITKHGAPGNNTYDPSDFRTAYVNINMMTGIYGGNTSDGAPGAASFKHNAFRMWGYFGYENGFIGYVSNKLKGEANKAGKTLSDKYIINKVSGGTFNTLEEWKKEWFKQIKTKAQKGFTAIEIDGKTIDSYDKLKDLFDKAVENDFARGGTSNTETLKAKVYKALLKNTDGFTGKLFKD